jgi:hypothetical protein
MYAINGKICTAAITGQIHSNFHLHESNEFWTNTFHQHGDSLLKESLYVTLNPLVRSPRNRITPHLFQSRPSHWSSGSSKKVSIYRNAKERLTSPSDNAQATMKWLLWRKGSEVNV